MTHLKKQAGISLLELIIALSLGLILLAGLISVYLVANRSSSQASFVAQMDQSANDIFYRIGTDAKQAGFVDVMDSPTVPFTTASKTCVAAGEQYGNLLGNLDYSVVDDIYKRTLTDESYANRGAVRLSSDSSSTEIDLRENRFMTPLGLISCGNMQPIIGCDGVLSDDPSAAALPACNSDLTMGKTQQQIQFAYQAIDVNASSDLGALPDTAVDCAGNRLSNVDAAGKTQNGFTVNRYFLGTDQPAGNESALMCMGNAGADPKPVALVDGVQELNFRYALTSLSSPSSEDLSSRVVTKYADADELNGEANADDSFGWSQVVGVEVCFVLSAPIPNTAGMRALARVQGNTRPTCERKDDGSFEDNVAKTEAEQNRYFKRYDKVIALPNMLYSQAGD